MVIDAHTHAFPDALAPRAIRSLEQEGDITAHLDGTVTALLDSMDKAGIDVSVVASIATRPEQFEPILEWSEQVQSDRIVPFPSVHPADPHAVDHVSRIKAAGFRGVKLHPYYQQFSLAEDRILPLFERIESEDLVLLLHAGFDLAFDRVRVVSPAMIRQTAQRFPGLRLIAPHLGGWEDWDEAEEHVIGRSIYIDTSYSLPFLGTERARRFLTAHPEEYILFGTDSPWTSQIAERGAVEQLGLSSHRTAQLMGENARRLLGL